MTKFCQHSTNSMFSYKVEFQVSLFIFVHLKMFLQFPAFHLQASPSTAFSSSIFSKYCYNFEFNAEKKEEKKSYPYQLALELFHIHDVL
ncbi:hypothetical protein RDI58_013199 [Solanum bulbocastanum]|uniref:Uncharacterized protein n=1 Tax=Solanum bulbocastanum TaxID=147425 RepID=A0AAN8YDV7_SOLBU